MTTAHKIELGVAFVAFVLLLVVGYAWLGAHDAALRAQSATEERQQVDKQLEQIRRDTQTQLENASKAVEALRQQLARTPATTAPQIIREQVPFTRDMQPTIITVPAQAATTTTPAVPAQQVVQFPLPAFQQAEKNVAARLLDCSEHEGQLTACQADKKTDVQQMQALERERDAYRLAAGHGGGFWVRLRRNAKWVGALAATGAVTYAVGRAGGR